MVILQHYLNSNIKSTICITEMKYVERSSFGRIFDKIINRCNNLKYVYIVNNHYKITAKLNTNVYFMVISIAFLGSLIGVRIR